MLPRKVGPGLALNSIEAITSNLLKFITERGLSVDFNRINSFISRQDRIPRQGARAASGRGAGVPCVGVLGAAPRRRGKGAPQDHLLHVKRQPWDVRFAKRGRS